MEKEIKVVLRISKGIYTRGITLPRGALRYWRVPLHRALSFKIIKEIDGIGLEPPPQMPYLEFQWDESSMYSGKDAKTPIYILDIIGVRDGTV